MPGQESSQRRRTSSLGRAPAARVLEEVRTSGALTPSPRSRRGGARNAPPRVGLAVRAERAQSQAPAGDSVPQVFFENVTLPEPSHVQSIVTSFVTTFRMT